MQVLYIWKWKKKHLFISIASIPARTPISMKTSVPHELMGPKARLWVSNPTSASSCSSEQDSLSWPSQSTALLQPPGRDNKTVCREANYMLENHPQQIPRSSVWAQKEDNQKCLLKKKKVLTWTQLHWTNWSLRFLLHTRCVPSPLACWSPAGSDSAWWKLIWQQRAQPAGMKRGYRQTPSLSLQTLCLK